MYDPILGNLHADVRATGDTITVEDRARQED
jgi:hypothetical protein